MKLRTWFAVGSVALLALAPGSVSGAGECREKAPGVMTCVAGIPSQKMNAVAAFQKKSQWCWAASIEMAFRFHGHPIDQRQIVIQTYGSEVNLPAGNGQTMTTALNRVYKDQNGKRFRARTKVFDISAGKAQITNADIIRELRAGRPLIMGALGHAVVLTSLNYDMNAHGHIAVTGGTVRDPWPDEGRPRGLRNLKWGEMSPTYVATVVVEEVADSEDEKAKDEGKGKDKAKDKGEGDSEGDDDKPKSKKEECIEACNDKHETCIDDIDSLDDCIDDYEYVRCPDTCENRYGHSPSECRVICDRNTGKNLEVWTKACESQIAKEKKKCDRERKTCKRECTSADD